MPLPAPGGRGPRGLDCPRVWRPLALLLVAALALGACGDDGGDDAGAATLVKLDEKGLRAIKRFAPADARAIERVYRALIEFEDAEASSRAEVDAALRPTLDSCRALDADDPLLSVLRASCPVLGVFYRNLTELGTCEEGDACRDAALAAVAALRDNVKLTRHEGRAVRATRLPRACKRVLITPRSTYSAYNDLDAALEGVATAMESGTDDDRIAALAALATLDGGSSGSTKSSLRRFRAHCR
jgi:hypothetical protein